MKELNWAGRLFLLIALMRWVFYPTTNETLIAATKVLCIVALVFMYADLWAILSWLWKQGKRLDAIIKLDFFQKSLWWFLLIVLFPASVAMLMQFALSKDTQMQALYCIYGGVLLVVWVALVVNFKKL